MYVDYKKRVSVLLSKFLRQELSLIDENRVVSKLGKLFISMYANYCLQHNAIIVLRSSSIRRRLL